MTTHHRTPALADKRLWLTAGVIVAIIVARGFHVDLGDKVIDAILLLTVAYVGQSQVGQTIRSTKAKGAPDAPPAA